jgi:gamma-glutamylcyclotransferase (GGCT)/AIG2-like uncharacterized protein YtfP
MKTLLFAVNGTLMQGLPLNKNLLAVNAAFVRESRTSANYRLWSIHNQYPAMIRDLKSGQKIELEIWSLTPEALLSILQNEPPGLCLGRVELENGETVIGVLGENFIIQGQQEITKWGGWRAFIALENSNQNNHFNQNK